jgi:hypothetical protein
MHFDISHIKARYTLHIVHQRFKFLAVVGSKVQK